MEWNDYKFQKLLEGNGIWGCHLIFKILPLRQKVQVQLSNFIAFIFTSGILVSSHCQRLVATGEQFFSVPGPSLKSVLKSPSGPLRTVLICICKIMQPENHMTYSEN